MKRETTNPVVDAIVLGIIVAWIVAGFWWVGR
jgi:hypothetical protein